MSAKLTDLQLLHELEPVVEKYLNRHLSMHKPWNRTTTSRGRTGRTTTRSAGRIGTPTRASFLMSPRWRWCRTWSPRTTCRRITARSR